MLRNKRLIFVILLMIMTFTSSIGVFAKLEPDPFITEEEKKLQILMYHFIRKSSFGKWDISPDEFEADLKYLKENGYETIVVADLIDFVYYGKPLPEKPIMLTFDDGDTSVYNDVLPLLKKYDMKIVLAVLGKCTDKYTEMTEDIYYPNLKWGQIKELHDSGLVEIQNHSYDLHHGIGSKKKNKESIENYAHRLLADLNKLQARIQDQTGFTPTAFVYPFGAISNDADGILKENGFYASFSCGERMNTVRSGDPDSLFSLGRYLRPHGRSQEQMFGINN